MRQLKQPVKSNQDGLQCDACDSWYHLRCLPEAIRISRAEYTRLSQTNEDWYCYECQLPPLTDSSFSTPDDNTDHTNVSEHTSSMCTELIPELNELRIKNSKSLIIGNLNINILRNKFSEVKESLNNRLLDCLILCETKLDASFPDARFNVTEYRMYRKDRNAHGGGVMVFIRSDIPSRNVKDIEHANIESLAIEYTVNKTKWVLHSVYRPPSGNATRFRDYMSIILDMSLTRADNILLAGDLNLDALLPETSGKVLHDLSYDSRVKL